MAMLPQYYKRKTNYTLIITSSPSDSMIENIQECSKQFAKTLCFTPDSLITIHQTHSQHSDFLTISFLIDRLAHGHPVTFLAIRENYAHYLALSKKIGKSLEPYIRSELLTYYECFNHEFCSELPLTESSPAVYVRPPKTVKTIAMSEINKCFSQNKNESTIIVDALSFIEHLPELCYEIYENAINSKCQLILAGCSEKGEVSQLLRNQAHVSFQVENDVAGHGKFKMGKDGNETSLLWKWVSGEFVLSKFMKL